MKTVSINILASVLEFNFRFHLVKMHLSDTAPKQFEDSDGNLWFAREIYDLNHLDN